MTTPITIVGNLTGDPELRFTPSGQAVCNFTVAVNERVKDDTAPGGWRDGEGSFYNIAVWGTFGENCAETLTRGMRVVVSGGLKMRSYERRDGNGKGLSADITVGNDGAVGPDLKWATAKVTRTTNSNSNNGGGQGGQPQGGYQQPQQGGYNQPQNQPVGAPAGDPWGTSSNDEPPF